MKKRTWICAFILILMSAGCALQEDRPEPKSYPDTGKERNEAEDSFQTEDYRKSLEQYLAAMEANPQDTEAFLGVIRCQIELENYDIAVTDIRELISREPAMKDAYELYLEVGEKTEAISYKQDAVELADRNHVSSIMEKVPEAPVADFGSGVYEDKLTVTLTAAQEDATIYYSYRNEEYGINTGWREYREGILIMGGEGSIESYLVLDGMPSLKISNTYEVNYGGTEVQFKDKAMELLIRQVLDIHDRPLLDTDCYGITSLDTYRLNGLPGYDEMPQIHSLADLDKMPLLDYLYLDDQHEISDYSAIAGCSCLRSFYTYRTGISDISFLEGLGELSTVYFQYEEELKNISPLKKHHKLRTLGMRECGAGSVDEILKGNPELTSVYISTSQLNDQKLLTELPDLRYLEMQGLTGLDLKVIASLKELTSLQISADWDTDSREKNALDDLSFLDDMKELTQLDLDLVQDPEQLKHIYGLSKLKYLYLYSCEATEDSDAMDALKNELPSTCKLNY
ncbi:MAG: hypothetical protein K5697_06720 [Lachnospiraceae bacterium]|nr:hypothetical protein [Lachnospiraceae bacterium]